MHVLKDICNNLEYQLEDIVKKDDWTPNELDLVYKSVKTMYYIKTITAMEEYSNDDGYSRAGRSMDGGYSRRGSYAYDMDYSGRRGGRGRYSREDGKDVMKELGEMMARATSESERQTIAKLMDRFE